MKKILKYIIIFIGLIVIFNVLLLLSSLFPSALIEKNVRESAKILKEQGNYYLISIFSDDINNNYTDVLMINEAYSINSKNPIFSYMSVRKNFYNGITKHQLPDTHGELVSVGTEEYDPSTELVEFLNGNIDTSIEYARYWHGYLSVLRPLLLFFNVTQIRYILFGAYTILLTMMFYLLKKKFNLRIAIIYAFALIANGFLGASFSLESSPVFLVMLVSSIILLERIDKIKDFYIYIFVVACIANFVDYLTVPLITLAFPLSIYILYKQKEELEIKDSIKIIIKASIVWILGYGITWFSKWVLFDLLYDRNLIKSAIDQVLYRSGRTNENIDLSLGEYLFYYIKRNFKYIIFFSIATLYINMTMLILKDIIININKFKDFIKNSIPFLIISMMPIVWYIVLANHTTLHFMFTYRHISIFLLGILLTINNTYSLKYAKKDD